MKGFNFYKLLIFSFLNICFQLYTFGSTINRLFPFENQTIQEIAINLEKKTFKSTLSHRAPCAVHRSPSLDTLPKPSKYQGYRLFITQIKVEKEASNWVRINFTAINTGDREVDFGQKGREHWVQVLFDDSIRSSKLGGFKDNIRQGLYNDNFKLDVGKIATDQEIKFSKILEWSQPKEEKQASDVVILTAKIGEESTIDEQMIEEVENCPDLVFSNFKIVEKKKKYVVIEYSVKNIGKGPALLKKKEKGADVLIGLRVFLSGAPVVSRASKELGMDVLRVPYYKKDLYPDEEITQQIEVKTRDKTTFLKYLVMQIDSYQLMRECDRRNNEEAVELK